MFASGQTTLDALILIGTAGPIAIYFLTLGFINSHARPLMVSSRTDFLALSIAVAPLALWALPFTMQFASAWWTALGIALLAIGLYALRPQAPEALVIYNIDRDRLMRMMPQVVAEAAPDAAKISDTDWQSPDRGLHISVSSFSLLRNVTIRLVGDIDRVRTASDALRRSLQPRFERIEQLPSPAGACLVVTGAAIAIVPMWLLTRHVNDFVEVVTLLLD